MTDAQERAEDQRFWDAVFCAVLTGAWSNPELLVITKRAHDNTGKLPGDRLADMATEQADAALAARRQRKEQE